MDYLLAEFKTGNDSAGTPLYQWYDTKCDAYKEYEQKYASWKTEYDEAYTTFTDAKAIMDTVFTDDNKNKIEFYDTLFSSIADNGWSYSSEIDNPEYLNQMLQNNLFTITTVVPDRTQNEDSGQYEWNNIYNTDIASNMNNLVLVSDSDTQNEALAKYEDRKSRINQKESRIDIRMQDLRTEQDAVNTMIKSIESQKNEWIDRTFNLYS